MIPEITGNAPLARIAISDIDLSTILVTFSCFNCKRVVGSFLSAARVIVITNMTNTLRTLWLTFGKYRWHIVALTALGFLAAIVEGIGVNAVIPLASFFTSGGVPTDFISRAIQGVFAFIGIPFKFRYLIAFILFMFMVRAVSTVVFGYIRGWISADYYNSESQALLKRAFSASWPFLLKQKLGYVHTTMVRDLQCTTGLLGTVSQMIQSFSGMLMYLLVAINISPMVTVSAAIGGVVLLGVVRPFTLRLQRIGNETAAREKDISNFLTEHVIGMKAIKVAGKEGIALSAGEMLMNGLRTLQTRAALTQSLGTSLFQPFSIIFVLILFAMMYNTPGFSFISFAAALYLVQKIFTYLESGQGAFNSMVALLPYAENMTSFKNSLADHAQHEGHGTHKFVFEKELSFENVIFAYSATSNPVLRDVSFSVKRGETVGLIGPSGAGKTSVADIILRLFNPTSGQVILDGVSVENISLTEWRSHIGYVPQDVFMFNGSVEENIRFYRSELTTEEIHAAAKQANIHDFVMALPEGFNSHVGDRGVMISGGQRQRIALARALAGKPDLLVLDEATSALDSESERLIQEAIQRLHGEITVIIIAHRLSTVENADTILVLDKGEIIERGSPAELRANPASYFSTHGGA